jgi:hypothetical protein
MSLVVGIKKGTNPQVIHYRLEVTAIGRRQELKGKTIGYRRYKVEERLIEGCRW